MNIRRAVRTTLAGIGLLVVLAVALLVLATYLLSRPPGVPASATLVLRPGGTLLETAPTGLLGQVLGGEASTVRGFVTMLEMARRDPRIKTVLLIPSTLESPYWAKLQELRDALIRFRRSGKAVVAFLEYGGDREYYLATAADRIVLLPSSPLDLTGVASYHIFLRGALDRLGVYPDYLHVGEYKAAPNQLTETRMTPAHREMAEALNRDAFDQLVSGIAASREKRESDVRTLLDQGPFVPAEALRTGLVDALAYEDQLDDRIPELRDADGQRARVEGSIYQRISPGSVGIRPASRIAVLYASGTIVSGESRFDPTSGSTIGSDTLVGQIRRVRADPSVKAIVLRVDSPGGSSTASDVIWRELVVTRDAQPDRPLIASMSDLAASGGYYISAPAHVVVAEPGTLTGSIGIYTGKLAMGEALRSIGVTEETVKTGANADIYSPFAPFTPDQRQKLQRYLEDFYAGFVEKVAKGRHLTPAAVDALGRGRVWTGAQAKQRGLVDELGGLQTAIGIAKQRAGIPADQDVEIVSLASGGSVFEVLAARLRGAAAANVWGALAGSTEARAIRTATATGRLFRRGEPLALMPYTFVR